MNSDDEPSTPPDVRVIANNASLLLLPSSSRAKYEKAFETFSAWRTSKGIAESLATENVLLGYLSELSERYAASTLWTTYSMLNKTILLNNGIDISTYAKVRAFLKRGSAGQTVKKSGVFTREQVGQFICETDDEQYLHIKTIVLFSLFGAC
jgi:hypothetical protein